MHNDEDLRLLAGAVERQAAAIRPGESAWQAITSLGLPALALPEEAGGAGGSAFAFHTVMEVLGRYGVQSPFLSSAMCCTRLVLELAGAALRERLLAGLVSGELVLTLVHGAEGASIRAVPVGRGWKLDGHKPVVLHGGEAGAWLVSAAIDAGGSGVFWLERGAPGVDVREFPCIDGSVGCELRLRDVVVTEENVLGMPGNNTDRTIGAAIDWTLMGQCAESVGLQSALLETTVDYVKTRRQFGAPIGSFQVVQHRLAEMLLALEQARSLSWAAARAAAAPERDRQRMTSAAKARCVESARFIGMQAIQLHGGIGMTDELPVGRWVKRLLAIEHTLGDQRYHLTRLARLA